MSEAMRIFRRAIAAFVALCTLLLPFSGTMAYRDALSGALSYLYSGSAPDYGSVGGEWKVMALARSGHVSPDDDYFERYSEQIEDIALSSQDGIIDVGRATENARVVIALSSIGKRSTDISGVDIVAPLSDFNFVKRQGINGVIFSLLAVDTYGFECPARNDMIAFILGRQLESGGWAIVGQSADIDVTAMAMTVLAPYRGRDNVSRAIDKALSFISEVQSEDGGFISFSVSSSETCSQVVVALSTLGIDADSDPRFIKNGTSVLDALLSFSLSSGAFEHEHEGGASAMATEQAAYALAAYRRFKTGGRSLYDMRDVMPSASLPTPAPTITPTVAPTPFPTLAPTQPLSPTLSQTPIEENTLPPYDTYTHEGSLTGAPLQTMGTLAPENTLDAEATFSLFLEGSQKPPEQIDDSLLWLIVPGIIVAGVALGFIFIKRRA